MKNERLIRRMLQEKFGDPIGSYAGNAPVGVRSERNSGCDCEECRISGGDCGCGTTDVCPECGMMPIEGKCGCSEQVWESKVEPCSECGMMEVEGSCGCTHLEESKIEEVTPKGYEKIVKALKKSPSVENAWALSWWMKGKGIKPKKRKKSTK